MDRKRDASMTVLDNQQQWNAFINTALPTRENEHWKYTDFAALKNQSFEFTMLPEAASISDRLPSLRLPTTDSILLVILNGYFMPALSDMHKLPEQVIACHLQDALTTHAALVNQCHLTEIDAQQYPFAKMNAMMFTDGLFLWIPNHICLSLPIHLLSIAESENEFVAHPRHLIGLGDQSQITVIEEYVALSNKPYMMNVVTNLVTGNNATLEHVKIQRENHLAIHMANTFVKQQQYSKTTFSGFSLGGRFSRDDLVVTLQERGAACKASGFYRLQQDDQYMDHHVEIRHAASYSSSDMLFKGIVDKKSRAVFNGKLRVMTNAQQIVASQANHNLLLSQNAEVYSKPELEIDADDVKCQHGATTGQLDQEALFYLRARGIPQAEAVNILLQGFAEDLLDRISYPDIRQRVRESM